MQYVTAVQLRSERYATMKFQQKKNVNIFLRRRHKNGIGSMDLKNNDD